jgi:hypothetical protein
MVGAIFYTGVNRQEGKLKADYRMVFFEPV